MDGVQLDFNYDVYWIWNLFGQEFYITESIFNTWMVGIFLLVVAVIVRIKVKSFTDVPTTKLQIVVEAAVDAIQNLVKTNLGEKYAYFGTWFFGVFAYIWACNLSGLVGLRPPTADLATTAALGVSTFCIIHVMGVRVQKGKYFKEYLQPVPLFLPMNIAGELAIPVSLSLRMFGNILAGTIIMGLMYGLFPPFMKVILPAPFHFYFDVFAGSMQAFIFTILSLVFINKKLVTEE